MSRSHAVEMAEKTAVRKSVTIGMLGQHGENVKMIINQEPKEDEKAVHRERKPVRKIAKNINMAYTLCPHKPTNQRSRRHLQKHQDATKIKFRWDMKKDPVRTGSILTGKMLCHKQMSA